MERLLERWLAGFRALFGGGHDRWVRPANEFTRAIDSALNAPLETDPAAAVRVEPTAPPVAEAKAAAVPATAPAAAESSPAMPPGVAAEPVMRQEDGPAAAPGSSPAAEEAPGSAAASGGGAERAA